MTKDRTAYWREYARKNSARRKEISAAFRERNREKINAANRSRIRAKPKPKPKLDQLKKRFAEYRRSKL